MQYSLIPETKNKSLEEMDIIFGAVSAEERQTYINRREQGKQSLVFLEILVEFCRSIWRCWQWLAFCAVWVHWKKGLVKEILLCWHVKTCIMTLKVYHDLLQLKTF